MPKIIMDVERIHALEADILDGTQPTIEKQTVFANDTKRLLVHEEGGGFTKFPNIIETILANGTVNFTGDQSHGGNDITNVGNITTDSISYEGFVNAKSYGATGDGVTDDTAAINSAIQATTSGWVFLPPGSYVISDSINLKTGVSLCGVPNKSILTCAGTRLNDVQDSPYITGTADDLEIRHITIDGNGSFSTDAFSNPYGAGDQYGYINQNRGIYLNQCHNVKVIECNIYGVEDGIFFACTGWGDPALESRDITIHGCKIWNVGKDGIRAFTTKRCTITENNISNIQGPMAATLADSWAADGIYANRIWDCVISDNVIDDFIRMGIVLEGNDLTATGSTSATTVSNNVVFNGHDARGVESNRGIYAERSSALHPIIYSGNVVHDIDGGGITIQGGILSGGAVFDCTEYGVTTTSGIIDGVDIYGCGYGVFLASSGNASFRMSLRNCTIKDCTTGGVYIDQGKDGIEIANNFIEDNELFGIYIEVPTIGNYTPIIKDNVFVSSAAAAAVSGQLYGVLIKASSITNSYSKNWSNNKFIFTGDFTGYDYPANLAAVPASMAFENPALTYTIAEIGAGHNGNYNSKYGILFNLATSSASGVQRFLGFATAAPGSGTFVAGDYYLNSAVASSQPLYFMCVAGGTPGTWQKFAWGPNIVDNISITGTLAVSGTSAFSDNVGIAGAVSNSAQLYFRRTPITTGTTQYGINMQSVFGSNAENIVGISIGSLTLSIAATPLTLTDVYMHDVASAVLDASQSISGDLIGLNIRDQTVSSGTNYAIKTGAGRVSFGDDVGVGTTTPGAKLHVVGTDGIIVPIGTDDQRVATQGMIRYNTESSKFEGYTGAVWVDFH